MSLPLHGRTAVVTGAGRGIGRATAMQLGALGAAVVVNDLGTSTDGAGQDAGPAAAVAAEIEAAGGRAMASPVSVTDFGAVERMMAEAAERFGGVDILVNNAGITAGGPIWELEPEVFARISASHATGTFNGICCAAPYMQRRRWGRIVNLVSKPTRHPHTCGRRMSPGLSCSGECSRSPFWRALTAAVGCVCWRPSKTGRSSSRS